MWRQKSPMQREKLVILTLFLAENITYYALIGKRRGQICTQHKTKIGNIDSIFDKKLLRYITKTDVKNSLAILTLFLAENITYYVILRKQR